MRNRVANVAAGIALALAVLAPPAAAKVDAQSPAGFAVSHEAVVAAPPASVWAALLAPARWWSASHSWSGDAANFTLTPGQGGCLCERLPGGGFVEHARIIHLAPERMLRLSGALGPLQGEGLAGTITFTLKPDGAGTRLRLESAVGGYARFDLAKIAPAVDGVLGEQHARLIRLIETGSPDAKPAAR